MTALPISVISSTFKEKLREHNQGIEVRARRKEKRHAITKKLRARFYSSQGHGWGGSRSSLEDGAATSGWWTGNKTSRDSLSLPPSPSMSRPSSFAGQLPAAGAVVV